MLSYACTRKLSYTSRVFLYSQKTSAVWPLPPPQFSTLTLRVVKHHALFVLINNSYWLNETHLEDPWGKPWYCRVAPLHSWLINYDACVWLTIFSSLCLLSWIRQQQKIYARKITSYCFSSVYETLYAGCHICT